METIQELKTVKAIVNMLLKSDERCRNDDKWLTYRVMRHFTKIYIPFEDFQRIPAFETIKRMRAWAQNRDKKFLPTSEKVRIRRRIREEDFKEELQ